MKFKWRKTGDEWRWRLRASNGEIIASGEGYKSKRACLHCIDLIKQATNAPVEEDDEVEESLGDRLAKLLDVKKK